jgi:hypothetical protein
MTMFVSSCRADEEAQMFTAMEFDDDGGLVGYVSTMAEAKAQAYKTAAWALAHGYGPYVLTIGLDSVKFSCPGLSDMTFKVND